MKKLFFLIFFNTFVFSDIDWSDVNSCKLPDYSNFVDEIIDEMTLEQKVGQIIMPEINSITIEQVRKFHFGTVLNGGGGFPNKNKNSSIDEIKSRFKKIVKELHPDTVGQNEKNKDKLAKVLEAYKIIKEQYDNNGKSKSQ